MLGRASYHCGASAAFFQLRVIGRLVWMELSIVIGKTIRQRMDQIRWPTWLRGYLLLWMFMLPPEMGWALPRAAAENLSAVASSGRVPRQSHPCHLAHGRK